MKMSDRRYFIEYIDRTYVGIMEKRLVCIDGDSMGVIAYYHDNNGKEGWESLGNKNMHGKVYEHWAKDLDNEITKEEAVAILMGAV
jgi:hypothetical protein